MPLDETDTQRLQAESNSSPERQVLLATNRRVVDLEHPWLGLDSFREEDRGYFFGRDAEIAEIRLRLRSNPLLVLYSRSGLGKTSVIKAGLIPRLRIEHHYPALERLRYEGGAASLCNQIFLALFGGEGGEPGRESSAEVNLRSADHVATRMDRLRTWEGEVNATLAFPMPDDAASRLWLRLHWRKRPPNVTHLILDQFEEVFTLGARLPGAESEVRDALGILLQGAIPEPISRLIAEHDTFVDCVDPNSTPVRVVLALRDDYVYALNRWKRHIPGLGQNNFELRALRSPDAFKAVFKPGELRRYYRGEVSDANRADTGLPPIISKETAQRIVRFVVDNKPEDVPVEDIEVVPPILSLLCSELNARRFTEPDGTPEKPAAQIAFREGETDIKTIIAAFYERCLSGRPAAVRIFIEEELVSSYSGGRLLQDEKAILRVFEAGCEIPGAADGRRAEGYGNAADARACLHDLVNQRLLTSIGGELPNYELIHDLLARVAEKSRVRREQEILTERANLRAEAEKQAKDAEAERAQTLSELLAAEEASRRKADRATLKATRWTVLACFVALAAIAALIIALFFYEQSKSARAKAEDLVGFLIGESLLEKLRPVGRNEILEQVQTKVERSLRDAPHAGDPRYERNCGLALRNKGALLQARGQLQGAITAYQEARNLFERWVRRNPKESDWQQELARTLDMLGTALRDQAKCRDALACYEKSFALRQTLYDRNPESPKAILDVAEAHNSLGDVNTQLGRIAIALPHYKKVLELVEPLREKPAADQQRVLKLLNESYDGLAEGLRLSGKPEQREAVDKGLEIARKLVLDNPLDSDARRREATSLSRLANLRVAKEGGSEELLEAYNKLHTTFEELVRWDKTNVSWQRESAATLLLLGQAYSDLRRFNDATNAFDKAFKELSDLSRIDPSNVTLKKDLSWPHSSRGTMLRDRRDWPGALTAFKAEAEVLAKVAGNEQSPVAWRQELGWALWNLGSVQVEQKEFTNAVGSFRQGRTVITDLCSKAPEMAVLLNDLLALYDAEAEAWRAQGKTQEADALGREADGVLQQEISRRPDNPIVWYGAWLHQSRPGDTARDRGQATNAHDAYRKGLESIRKAVEPDPHRWDFILSESNTHEKIGDLLSEAKDWSEAKQAYDDALAAAKKGLSRSPNVDLQNQIHRIHVATGEMFRDQGKRDKAINEYTQAKSAIEEAMRMAPTKPVYVSNLGDVQRCIGEVKRKAKDPAGAKAAYREAVAAAQQAAKLAPDNGFYANKLHIALFDLGGILDENGDDSGALAQYTLALSALENAKIAGLDQPDYLESVGRLHWRIAKVRHQAGDLLGGEAAYRAAVDAAKRASELV